MATGLAKQFFFCHFGDPCFFFVRAATVPLFVHVLLLLLLLLVFWYLLKGGFYARKSQCVCAVSTLTRSYARIN